jgi:hypothetical protein
MTIPELENLNYLHDATVLSIRYTMAEDGSRDIVIETICHYDSGFEFWNGKQVNVLLKNVILLEQFLYGFTSGREEIGSWDFAIPASLESEAQRLQKLGVNCSGIRFAVSFHTGSYMRGICRQIDVLIDPVALPT